MSIDDQIKFSYNQAAKKLISKEKQETGFKGFANSTIDPSSVVTPNPSMPWQKNFQFDKLKISLKNDFEGGNLKRCQITDYNPDPNNLSIKFNIWLYSD